MNAYIYALLLGFGGIFAASLWVFALGIAGAPGAALVTLIRNKAPRGSLVTLGFLLTVAGQLYVALIFVVFVIQTSRSMLSDGSGFGYWLAWFISFLVATAPTAIAVRDGRQSEQLNIQHYAVGATSTLTIIGYFIFIFAPRMIEIGWAWVPHL